MLLSASMSLICIGQELEVDGKVKLNDMDTVSSGNMIVIRDGDSILALTRFEELIKPLIRFFLNQQSPGNFHPV